MSLTNHEIVNLLVQTKVEKLQQEHSDCAEECLALNAEILADCEKISAAVLRHAEELPTTASAQKTLRRWQACGVLFEGELKLLPPLLTTVLGANPHYDPYYVKTLDTENTPSDLFLYWAINGEPIRVNQINQFLGESVELNEEEKKTLRALAIKWAKLDRMKTRQGRLSREMSDTDKMEKRALAALTKRTLTRDETLREEVQLALDDVLSETKLIDSI